MLLLIICNLTVSIGTINGHIFYANIVWVNHTNFFKIPNIFGVRVFLFQQVLAVFIALLNLDLGIETCFVNGMDAYIRTWLQYVLPLYHLLKQTFHHYCQTGGLKCSLSACNSVGLSACNSVVSPFICQTAADCHHGFLLHIIIYRTTMGMTSH